MPGRVLVTGASGFVGSAVIDQLLARGFAVTALVHRRLPGASAQIRTVTGGIFDPRALDDACSGCDAVIHLVGIIAEKPSRGMTFQRIHVLGSKNVIDAARRNGISRFVHMSALGTRPDAVSTYHKTKFEAEEYLRNSGLEWTIFRPSLIHGAHGEFMRMEAKWARMQAPPFLFMPYFGAGLFGTGGAGILQPIHVNDVARAFVDALEKRRTIGEVYPIAGPDKITWPQLHQICSQAIVGRRRLTAHIPAWYARLIASIPGLRAILPFNRDQVIMSQEDNTTDITKFVDDFGWTPQSFTSALQQYAGKL
jgi:NADH dehydrogenase